MHNHTNILRTSSWPDSAPRRMQSADETNTGTATGEHPASMSAENADSAIERLGAVPRNRLLASLSPDELTRLRPHLEIVHLEQRELLFQPESVIRYVYFPETSVVSLVSTLQDGATVEVGTAGNEGMAGLSVFLAQDTSSVQAFAQIPGGAARLDADTFVQLASGPGELHRLMLRYTQAFLTQVAQTAACNGAHLVEERCARWLLMTHDRVDGNEFPLTHEFLAFMLGVRRAGVSVAMRALQEAGVVDYSRGWVEVVDRVGLERASCECYRVVRAHFDRLLPGSSQTH
jgi:CRP-like cAMP-binding protein